MAKHDKKKLFPHKLLLMVLLLSTGLVIGLYAMGQQTQSSQMAATPADLNSGLDIVQTINPDGTMGPDSWKDNFSSTLQRSSLGTLTVKVNNTQLTNDSNKIDEKLTSGRPLEVTSLSLTFNKAEVHLAQLDSASTDENVDGDGKWETLVLNDSSNPIDLAQLIKSGSLEIGTTQLAPGKYTEIRLYVKNAAATLKDGKEIPLTYPGKAKTIRIIQPFTVSQDETSMITIGFDVNKSIIQAGTIYLFTPVVSHFSLN